MVMHNRLLAHPPAALARSGRRAWLACVPRLSALLAVASLPTLADTPPDAEPIHHELRVVLVPGAGSIEVHDRLTFPREIPRRLRFRLHAALAVRSGEPGVQLRAGPTSDGDVPQRSYELVMPPGKRTAELRYHGKIRHPLVERSEGAGRERTDTPGTISRQGVFLDSGSHWYPRFGDELLSFRLTVELPAGWNSVSQGKRRFLATDGEIRVVRWEERQPQEDIYLVAGPFQVSRKRTPWGEARVYLRTYDDRLAKLYLDATAEYLDLYSRLLGPYPYAKFALVENFWESGYGMPSFTLLGPRVIRLPFIPRTSYPHEVLHNWWGNGVYVDVARGNWSEGLTTYLADHLFAEQAGTGADYRRAALQRYTDYVARERDFPLSQFRARHSEVTQAIGYNKSLMLFHMLRRELGDEPFVQALRRLYREYRFRRASFDDLRVAFEAVSGRKLGDWFGQWLDRVGAPQLSLDAVTVIEDNGAFRLRGSVAQSQDGPGYRLRVPLAVQFADAPTRRMTLVMEQRRLDFDLRFAARPLRLTADPQFDLFRRLDRAELPPSVGQLLGAERLLLVLPADAPAESQRAFERLAERWRELAGDVVVRRDSELASLPSDRAVWLLGWDNRFRPRLETALAGLVTVTGADVTFAGERFERRRHSLALTARHPGNPALALGWVASEDPAAIAGLARKLPHYGKYSYVAFTGDDPRNVAKGQWPVTDSPLSIRLAPDAPPLELPRRPALSEIAVD